MDKLLQTLTVVPGDALGLLGGAGVLSLSSAGPQVDSTLVQPEQSALRRTQLSCVASDLPDKEMSGTWKAKSQPSRTNRWK